METSAFYIAVFQRINDTQRNLIQAFVKRSTDSWWHEFTDVWIVESSNSANWWVDELRNFIPPEESGQVLVFRLPPVGEREWSGYATVSWWKWLQSKYAAPSGAPWPEDENEGTE